MTLNAWPWLLLLLPVFGLHLAAPRLQLGRPLRALSVALLVFALATPQLAGRSVGVDLYVLIDRSASVAELVDQEASGWLELIKKEQGADDRLWVVDFAREVRMRRGGAYDEPLPPQLETRLADALATVLAARDPERASRVLVFTDGDSTQPLSGLAEDFAEAQIPVDIRQISDPPGENAWVCGLWAPAQTPARAPMMLEAHVCASEDRRLPYRVLKGEEELLSGTLSVAEGRAQLRVQLPPPGPGASLYAIEIDPGPADARAGDNRRDRWVQGKGPGGALLLSPFSPDPVEGVLTQAGFTVRRPPSLEQLDPSLLSGSSLVVLNNVPAAQLGQRFLAALPFFVEAQGGGLWMLGGAHAFGVGGYQGSPIDPLLPLSMELKSEERKRAVSMVMVMDISGSMGMNVGGSTKLELAGSGAAKSISMLGAHDEVALIGVDTRPKLQIELSTLGDEKARLGELARRIAPGGGGIYLGVALEAAEKQLKRSKLKARHVLLFSDASDTEEPGDAFKTLARLRKAGVRVSVVALGSPADSDAALLKKVATAGDGEIFFVEDAATLPAVFEQASVELLRIGFSREPAAARPGGGWGQISSSPIAWPVEVPAYNINYRRAGPHVALELDEEEAPPLIAAWQRGAGRVAATGLPLSGPDSGPLRGWRDYGRFIETLADWAQRKEPPPGVSLFARMEGTRLSLELQNDARWEARFAKTPPELRLSIGGAVQPPSVWDRVGPGRWRLWAEVPPGERVLGAVKLPQSVLRFGPLSATTEVEWLRSPARRAALERLVHASGGTPRLQLRGLWQRPPGGVYALARPLIWLALIALLLDALLSRIGRGGPWRLPKIERRPRAQPAPVAWRADKAAAPASASDPEPSPTPEATPAAPAEGSMSSRLRRAKGKPR